MAALGDPTDASAQGAQGGFAPNAYIRIAPSGAITFIMSHTEVGQGIYTSACMLIAEELEVGLDQIQPEAAPPNAALYSDPDLGEQATGGSTIHQDKLGAAPAGGGSCPYHADRCGGQAVARIARKLHRGARRGQPPGYRPQP